MKHTDNDLSELFTRASETPTTHRLIEGDFNLPGVTWESNRLPGKLTKLSKTIDLGDWTQQVTGPSRLNNRLDLIFTSGINDVNVTISRPLSTSDHNTITADFKIPIGTGCHQKSTCYKRSLNLIRYSILLHHFVG